jgi:hypothetical protein
MMNLGGRHSALRLDDTVRNENIINTRQFGKRLALFCVQIVYKLLEILCMLNIYKML